MDFMLVAKTFDVLRISPPPKLILLEAQTLASAHVPPYPPDMPALLINVDLHELALHLKNVLLTTYPKEHTIYMVRGHPLSPLQRSSPICARRMDAPGTANRLMSLCENICSKNPMKLFLPLIP